MPEEVQERRNLTWLTEQLHSVVVDVEIAWLLFRGGPEPQSEAGVSQAPGTDRLQQLSDLVPRLAKLAGEIKSRA